VRYAVDLVLTRFWSRTLPPQRLERALNDRATQGWKFSRSITEKRRKFLIFTRDAHFLIFERPD
jgi:Domain of unknown function (DUF4177)